MTTIPPTIRHGRVASSELNAPVPWVSPPPANPRTILYAALLNHHVRPLPPPSNVAVTATVGGKRGGERAAAAVNDAAVLIIIGTMTPIIPMTKIVITVIMGIITDGDVAMASHAVIVGRKSTPPFAS